MIGAQAILVAKNSLRIIDSFVTPDQSKFEIYVLSALSKICETLRSIGTLINRIEVTNNHINELEEMCNLYFNFFALFFREYCQSTVWTLAYAVSYHDKLLYQKYGVGYGILTMQGKEAKHAAIKQELKTCSNLSLSESDTNKWHQLMHGNYIRCFYLPFHYPIQLYQPHYDLRNPKVSGKVCGWYRQIPDDFETCQSCYVATDYLQCIKREGRIPDIVMNVMKPVACEQCKQRFTDCI